MDSESASIRIEKLNENNFHIWKVKIRMVLCIRELEQYLSDDKPPPETDSKYQEWIRNDSKARAFIGLSLTNNHLEQVQHSKSAKDMWKSICDIYEKHTLLNQLTARRRFYTAEMKEFEKVLDFAAQVRLRASSLRSMGSSITDQDMAMTFLSGLPERFGVLISALDAMSDDKEKFTFDFVVSRCQQEEQRQLDRDKQSIEKSEAAALLAQKGKSRGDCVYCGKHNDSTKCWKKHPHLAPEGHPYKIKYKALLSRNKNDDEVDDSNIVCLMGKIRETALANNANISSIESRNRWFIDSGCSAHLCYDRSLFSTYTEVKHRPIDLGADYSTMIVGYGDIKLNINVHGQMKQCIIKAVQHAPKLKYQLLSVSIMTKLGLKADFDDRGVKLCRKSNGQLVATGTITDSGLYALDTLPITCNITNVSLMASLQTWHERMGHVNHAGIRNMFKNNVVEGLKISSMKHEDCEGCIMGKGHRKPFPKSKSSISRTSKLLQLIHSDAIGPLEIRSLGGSRYILTFIDDFSKWTVLYTMQKKSEVFDYFKKFKASAELHTSQSLEELHMHAESQSVNQESERSKLKILRSDSGTEYLSNEFKRFLADNGIKHELSVPYTPQQNGVAERMNRTLLEMTRSMLHHKDIPEHFWAEAVQTAVYIRNRMTSRTLPCHLTPYHRWYGKKPNLSHLRTFGSTCWYVVPKTKVKKLDSRARKAIMMGYTSQSKGYKLWDTTSEKFIVSRDVYFSNKPWNEQNEVQLRPEPNVHIPGLPSCNHAQSEGEENKTEPAPDENLGLSDEAEHNTNNDKELDKSPAPMPRRSTRNRKPPGEWWVTQSEHNGKEVVSTENALIVEDSVPESFAEAMLPANKDFWIPAIRKEEASIRENNTFSIVPRRPGMSIVPCRYVFRVKNGEPEVRIVAKGFRQKHGINYFETYSPVVSFTAIRCFLSYVAYLDLECDQMDVVTAFLNGDLNETIYMEMPAGFSDTSNNGQVCLLHKALYGLKQAPRQWYAKINAFLVEDLEFTSCSYEPCLYLRRNQHSIMLIVLYVDDLLIAGNNRVIVNEVKTQFSRRYKMKDLGPAQEFLGITITRNRARCMLHISQSAYASKILSRFRMVDAKCSLTPMEVDRSPQRVESNSFETKFPYREAIGSLMYLMVCTRPDIGFAVGKLSQFTESPRSEHWTAVKRVLRYIKSTISKGITYYEPENIKTVAYADSDWAGCPITRKSTEAYLFIFGGGAVAWRSRKQSVVSTSSCEAEYIAGFSCAKESIRLSSLLAEMKGEKELEPQQIFMDNQGAMALAKKSTTTNRSKHIDIRYHFLQDAVAKQKVKLNYIPTQDQLADILTKPLGPTRFQYLLNRIGIS